MHFTRTFSRLILVPFALGAVASCGARTDPTSSYAPIPAGDFPQIAARIFCGNIGGCCEAVNRTPSDQCMPAATAAFASALSPVRDDAVLPGRCLDSLLVATRACEKWVPCPELFDARDDHGSVGSPCAATCSKVSGGRGLTCQAAQRDAGGSGPVKNCYVGDGLFCSSATGTCQRRATTGGKCSDALGCAGSWCDGGVCMASAGAGADCSHTVSGCAEGLICEGANGLCNSSSARPGTACTCTLPKPEGSACRTDGECAASPCFMGRCVMPPFETSDLTMICSG